MVDVEGTVECERQGAIAIVRLNRPKALNALGPETLRDLARVLRTLRRAGDVRAVVLAGAGERAFSAGADIAAMNGMTATEARAYSHLGHEVFGRLETFDAPVVAAVRGVALGGGLELALAADQIIAAEDARLGLPETNLGLIPGFGGTQRLVLRVGLARARRLIYLGEMLSGSEAAAAGLVDEVVPAAHVHEAATRLATALAERAPVAIGQAKRMTRLAAQSLLAAGLEAEQQAFAAVFASEDAREGMRAFVDRRRPAWKGR